MSFSRGSNRVEGKIFYGHKIVLVTASPRFQSMLSSKLSDGNTPTVQINDIRYHVFQVSATSHVTFINHIIWKPFNEAITITFCSSHSLFYVWMQLVMQFLYSGGCNTLDVVAPGDILELMAAASFFQLEDLLRYTESRCAQMIDIDNVVAMYIHAKVKKRALNPFAQFKLNLNDLTCSISFICRCTMHRN